MLKKIGIMLCCLLFTIPVCTQASYMNDPSFQMGMQIGQALGDSLGSTTSNRLSRGKIKRNHYAVKDYLFDKSKRFVVATIAPQGASIEDSSVLTQASYILYDLLKDKYVIFPQPFVIDHYMQTHPETMNMPPQQVSNEVFKYVQTISDSIIFIKVKEFNEVRGVADVNMEIVVYPHHQPRAVFTYTESRYGVENATKEEVIVKILKKYADKFEDVFKDSKLPQSK